MYINPDFNYIYFILYLITSVKTFKSICKKSPKSRLKLNFKAFKFPILFWNICIYLNMFLNDFIVTCKVLFQLDPEQNLNKSTTNLNPHYLLLVQIHPMKQKSKKTNKQSKNKYFIDWFDSPTKIYTWLGTGTIWFQAQEHSTYPQDVYCTATRFHCFLYSLK